VLERQRHSDSANPYNRRAGNVPDAWCVGSDAAEDMVRSKMRKKKKFHMPAHCTDNKLLSAIFIAGTNALVSGLQDYRGSILGTDDLKLTTTAVDRNIKRFRRIWLWSMGIHSIDREFVSEAGVSFNQDVSQRVILPFFVTTVSFRSQLNDCVQRNLDVWKIVLRQIVEIGVAVKKFTSAHMLVMRLTGIAEWLDARQ
jgi:hypothetical protein